MKKENKDSIEFKKNFLDYYLSKIEEYVLFFAGLFIFISIFIQVLLRYIFHTPLYGLEELCAIIATWFYFIGTAYSTYSRSYVSADILPIFIKNPRIIKGAKIISLSISIVASGILFYYSYIFAQWVYKNNVITPTFLISLNCGFGALVIGSLLMLYHYIKIFLREINTKIQY